MRHGNLTFSREAQIRMEQRVIDEETAAIVVERGEVIEDTHHAGRGLPTRVYFDRVDGRPVHVVVAYESVEARGLVITVYEPTLDRWMPGFRERRRR
jgi:hypothetical protein